MEDKKPVSSDKWTEALYETLKLNNAYDKDYDTFYNDFYAPGIKGYTYRKDVYDDMTSHGLDLGATYEEFASKIGLHAIDPQTQQTPMGADSISKDMKPVEVTPTKKPEAKKEEKPEVSAEAVSENQHPTDTLQDFNPNVSRMRNAGTDYYLQAAEEISNNAYSKSLEELANQAAKDLKKKAYQKPKEDSYVRLNQTARYIPIRSLPKDADLDSVFKAALNFEQMCGGTKEYTFAPLGGDVQERFEKWKALNATADNNFTQETASMSPNAVYLQARNLQALGKERPAWISELRWNEASDPKNNIDYQEVAAKLVQEDQQRRLKRSDGAYPNNVSLNGMYHANYTASMASDIYNTGTINTLFVLFQDGRIRPLQAPDPSVLRGGWEAQRELFRRQYEKMTFGEEGKEGYTDPYEKNRVVGNFLQNGEVCHIIYFPYMIEQRRWDDAQELIKIGLGGKFNEKGVLLNPDDRLQIVPVVVKNGESEEDAIAKAKVELDNEISKKLPYKETYLQQQIAQAREALKKEQERLKQFGKHDAVKGSYLPPMFNSKYFDDLLESSTEEGVKRSDEVALARGNIRKLEESIKKYTQALEALRTGDKVGAWGGFLEGISDLDNWTFGLYNLRENLVAVKAHEGKMGQEAKDRLGLARSLSQESMSAFHRYGEGRFYGPGFGTGYSTPFTLGAIATYGAGNVAARGIIRGGSRMAAKYGTNWFFDTTIRATTRLAAINAAGVIDSSFQMPRIVSDAAIEKMGLMNYTFDENQRIVVTGTQQEKSWGHSLLHSGLNMLVQNASERVGTYVLEPVAKAFGIGKISLRSFGEAFPYNKTIHMIQNGAFAKAMSKVYGTFEKGGYDGFVNEVLEEYIANPMTATFDENYTFADIFDSRQNLDTALSVWASSIFMLGFSSTASSVKYYRTLRSVNSAYDKAEANARRLFGNENWDKIQNTILRLEGEPLVNAIYAGVCQNKSLSDEQKKAFLNYVRAQKAQAVFNNAVSEKYSFSLTGEELNEMNAMTIHAYAEGRNMQTPQEYAQAQQVFADTREMAMSALGVTDDIDAYLDTLGETPAEQLKKGVEVAKENGLDEKAANAALSAYLNAREQQKGAMDGITSDESIRRQHADSVIRQITFENEADSEGGSGKVILVNVKGREKPVFLVRGRYENGSITGETVVVSEGNGVIEMIPASEVEGIVEESDAVTERQRKYDKIDAENKEQQRLINLNMDTPLAGQGGILMDEEGHRRQVGIKCVFNDEQGNPASVLVVDQNNNDYLIPIDVFREQRGRGRKFEAIEPYLDETDEEYHAAEGPMNEEYNLANKEQEGVSEEDAQGAAEGVTPQSATDATEKPTKPEVKYDYHVKMKDGSGNAVSGRVTNLSADGVEIEFDAPYNGKMVDRIPLADFDNGVSEIADANGNVLWNETEAVGDTEVVPQVDAAPTQVGQNEIDESEEARQARINSSEYKYDKEMRVYGYTGHLYDYRNGVAIYLDEEGNPLIYLAAQNDNTYIGLFRDDSGMWSTKMENASNDKTVFKGLISAVMDMLPEGAKFYEHSNVSVDGLRVFAQQLNHGFKVSDETYECGLNGEDKANVLGSKFKGNGKFASIEHATEADLEHFKGVLKPYMEALGRTTDDIRLGEDGKVLLTLPILIKEGTNTKAGEDVSASDVSNTQKSPTRPIHESASDEVDTKPTGSQDEAHKPTALERIPVNEAGERMFEQADKETALDALDEMTGHNSANTAAIVIAQYKQAQADLEKLKKKAPTRKEPVLRGTPMEMLKAQQEADANYNTAVTQYNAQVAEAEAKLDAWTKIYALMNERERVAREQAEAEQRERDKKLHDEAVAKLEEQKRIAAEKAAEQDAVGTHAVNPKIKKKWNDAVKIEGNANAITLADGSTIRGRYVLTESGAATASHDVNNAYEPTEGFPIDENGESVNDRDYKRDKDAQRIVREMADNYDSRALQTPVIVSKDGVVLSGNNRTMSGELAAQQGTDKAYIDYLREFGKMFGFTSEQIEGMKHPRVVFVLDEALPYDAKTFARFNAEQQKKQSKPEHAVKLGKIVPDSVFASITNDISRFDRMSDFYADEKSVDSAISKLLEAGVINEMQLPELRTGNSLSASGKELIENALIGKVFQSSPDAVRQIIGNPTLRQSIIMGLNEIANNRTLAKSGYDLSQELGAAVDLVARAKTLHPDIYKEGVPVSPFGREQGLFDDEYGDSRVTDGIVLLLADLLNSGKPSELRKVLASYNNEAAAFAAGQIDMFSGEVTSKEELLNNVLNHFRNATPKEQQAIVDAAVAERKRRAEASKQVGDTSERSGSDVTNAEVGNSKDAGNGQQDSSKKTNTDKITPIGESDFGFVYDQFKGNAQGAIQQLMKMQDGEALGALHHDEIGDIDLVWGKAGTKKSDGYGLAKLVKFHPEVLDNLQGILDGMHITMRSENRVQLESDEYQAAVRLTWNGKEKLWLLTAFKKKETPEPTNSRTDVDSNLDGKSDDTATRQSSDVSADKDTESSPSPQENGPKNSTQSAIESASAEVETSPTEAQKKAGNYKMGHVKVGAFDVTIENPKGSERSGTDANGKKWSVKMNNTYGYIRGTEGVDGDHIDVFLAEDMDKWDGKYVFVVDQYNPDGTFDEHKVMLGFNSMEEARSAYLSNYEKGWENGRRIDVARIKTDGFQKWVDSSHRKTKPFAHYVIAGAADVAEGKPKNESDRAIPPSTSGKVRMQKTQGYSEFAEKYGVSVDDVRAYAEGMALGNVVMANQAFTEIRRTKRIEHRGMKLLEFAKAFNPIKKELYEKFGNVDELNQEYVRRAEEERNMMEAARKKAEEEERKRQAHLDELSLLDDAAIDERYMEALQRGDEATAREMLDEAARRKGYGDTASDYQGVGAWVAPANPGYENDAERRADVEDNAPDVNIEDIALGYSLVDEKYWQEPRKYMQTDATAIESVNAIREAIAAVRRGEKNVKVKVYRAVPTSVKEGKLRNGDWVTPSKDYAKMHGEHRLEGKYRIIEDEVSVNELWWDGNDSREWGFDNGKGYKYKNVKNNRKSDDLVTRDDKGNVIPPSKRFNQRKADERYQKAGTPLTPNSAEVALRDAIADLMRKSGLDVIDHEVGQQVLDEANRDELRMSLNDNREYEGKTSKERSDIQYKKAKELLSALHEAGFKGFEISRSITPFGVSTYIQGDLGLKFRISDHGVSSFGRIFGEEHISLNTSSEYVVQLAKDRKKDINAQAEKYKKERAIKEEREKRANEKWNRIKANFEGMVFKRNDRTYQDYDTFSNSISINRQNGHKYQRRYVMQTAIGKSGADTAYRYEWAEPADVDEYGVATNIGSDRPSLEFIEAYDEADTAPIIREHRVYHGSGADFDHFDHSHMGEGEGAQVYGWGTYVTEVKGIGEGYAIRSMNGSSMSHEELSLKRNELEYYIDSAKEKLPFLKGEYKAELEAQISEWEEQLKDYEEHNFLYTVEIPDDNGKNYLDWDENTGADLINRIRETLRKNADLKELYDGAELNAELERLAPKTPFSETYIFLYELLGSDKAASQMLHDMGFTGIKYPADYRRGGRADGAKNYVIFNEEDAKITDRIRFFRTSNGEAYGFTVGGKIYIDPRIATAETPIHEYAHLWATAMREGNPTEWKNIVGLMKGTSVWAEVQKLYPELKNDDDIADEVLATFSGRRGAERLRAEQQKIMQSNGSVFEKAAAVGALARVKQALSKFWKGVADFLGIHYTSAEEVADRVMKDLLEGVDPRKFGGKNDERVRKQFIGEKGAAAADHAEEVSVRLDNLAVAREMEKAGKDAKAIKMATGWERGADGKWRYEVGDVRFYDGLQLVNRNEKSIVTLNDLLEDNKEKDALFASYPSLKDMPVTLEDMGYNGAGEYSYKDKSLRLNTYLLTDDSGRFTEPAVSILNHEIQHAIQHIEGFARGGSLEEGQHYADEHKPLTPVQGDFVDTVNLYDKNKHTLSETYTLAKFVKDWAMFNDDDFSKDLLGMSDEQIRSEYERLKERQQHGGKPSLLNGFDAYKRFSGEVESRNIEARMGMTDEERRASLAAETEDVSREDQIFLQNGLNGVSESREPSIWLPKDEYAKVAHAIATNTGLKKTGMHYVFTDNNYYIYAGKKNGDFSVHYGLPIEGNENVIEKLSKGIDNGTIRNTRSLHSVIEGERSRQNNDYYNNVDAKRRQESTGTIGDLALRQPTDSRGSVGDLGTELHKGASAEHTGRGAGRGRIDDTSYRQSEDTPHVSTSSESKSQAAQKATENLNLGGRVVVHESAEGLEGKEATAKGWYDTRTGQIHVVLSNNADAADVTQTILHEAVAHHGLRELFGHNVMDAFLDSVLAAASQEVKDAINELRRENGWNFRTATEEYLAGLAERTDFERMTAEERGLFATIRRLFNRALEFLGLKNHELSDRELAYILWCSYQNLKTGEKGRYVAEAERIAMRYKLKAGKNAMTDTEKKESAVLLRGKLDNLQEILAKDTYERLVTSGSHLERTAWVDMLSPLQDLQHAIEKNGGFKLEDFENPYNAYVTMSSRNYAQMDIYKRTLYADMIEAIHALGSETGRSYEEIKTYVMAKHGMERQKYMAGKAAEEAYDRYKSMHPFGQKTLDDFIDEYKEKSFAGLTELFGTQSVSEAMDEAQKYVEEVEAEAGSLTDSMWDSIRAATKSSLQRAYEAGLISKETYDNVSSMYQYYIPLRGFDEATSDEVYEYFGDQTINGGTGSFMKKAKGRKSVADDPFAVIGNMAEMAIMQSNRNLMKQQLLNLALNHPSDLISVSNLYVKFDEDYDNGDGTRGAWVPVAVPDTNGMTTEEANQVMLDFQDDMEEKVKDEPDTYALAHQKPHIPYRVLGRNMNEHQVMVKRGGKTYILTINGNPRAAQAINGLLNPDATENPGAIALKAMTNWIARMATARNVEFAISNAMRDLEFSTTLIPKEGTEYYGRYVKNYLTCVKNIGRLVNRLNGNTLDMSNPLEKAFYDFIYNGGETGYTFMKGVERYKGEITKALSELRAKEGKSKTERLGNKIVYGHHYIINDAWNIYMKGAEYLSRCTEDWVRFAVFLTSRQSGRSMEQSIMDAKEVTVNFNRKGAGSKSAGTWDVSNFFSMNNLHFLSAYAASAFKNFYAFSNASIQGLDKNVRLHLNHTAGMLMWDGAAVALGMLSAMCIPLMLSAIGGDPDDYWDMPESMRRMGIMLPLGKDGRFLTLPMSIEHRAAYGIGELLGTVVCGSENLPASEITFQACEQLSQILPLDLTEGNGSMLSLVPTAVRPEVEIAFNKNWLGMPIYKEPFNKNTPAFRNVYQSTNPNYIAMSKWLNEVQGGGDYERAGVQVNPAMVQHLVESYTGGAGKFVSRTSGVIAKIIQGEQIRSNEIPFYRTLVKSVDDRTHNRAARERFQREYDKGQKLIYKIDNYQKESARGNSQYVKELDEFAKSKDFMSYMLWKSYNSVKSQFDNARSYIGDNKDKRAALDHAQMLVQKMMTECARAVENSKTQEEADEKIGRIQSEYTPQIKETLSKVED